MCVLFIAVDAHPRWPLIIAANRDEYHARPSAPMHRWPDQPGILAGRDRRAGGTWFGVNEHGRIAAVTNHRTGGLASHSTENPTENMSRGELVARFLRNTETAADYDKFLRSDYRNYSPFNLVYGEVGRLHYFSSVCATSRPLGVGFHSVSNGNLDDLWPKMSRGVLLLQDQVLSHGEIHSEALAQMMKNQTTADDHLLPRTGLAFAREKHLSSIFIAGEDYGTRTTTLLLGDGGDGFDVHEYNYDAAGDESDRQHYVLAIQPPTAGLHTRRKKA